MSNIRIDNSVNFRTLDRDELEVAAALAQAKLRDVSLLADGTGYNFAFGGPPGCDVQLMRAYSYFDQHPPQINYIHFRVPKSRRYWGDHPRPGPGKKGPTDIRVTRRYYRGKSEWEPAARGGITRCSISLPLFDKGLKHLRLMFFLGQTHCSYEDNFSYAEGRKWALKYATDSLRCFVKDNPEVLHQTIIASGGKRYVFGKSRGVGWSIHDEAPEIDFDEASEIGPAYIKEALDDLVSWDFRLADVRDRMFAPDSLDGEKEERPAGMRAVVVNGDSEDSPVESWPPNLQAKYHLARFMALKGISQEERVQLLINELEPFDFIDLAMGMSKKRVHDLE